jgi:mRNA-degrading endonuclease RelE of RelBE toxin-antitoxin system
MVIIMQQIEISNRAVKQLKKLSTDIRDRINEKILDLAENPRPSGVVKLENIAVLVHVRYTRRGTACSLHLAI